MRRFMLKMGEIAMVGVGIFLMLDGTAYVTHQQRASGQM
jgi:hypothetical protein